MNLKKLLSVLINQEKNLKSLLQIGLDKKETLVSSNYGKLSEVVAAEEQSLLSIQLQEEQRLNLMDRLFQEHNIDNKRYEDAWVIRKTHLLTDKHIC